MDHYQIGKFPSINLSQQKLECLLPFEHLRSYKNSCGCRHGGTVCILSTWGWGRRGVSLRPAGLQSKIVSQSHTEMWFSLTPKMQGFKDVFRSRGLLCPVWDESPQEEASRRVHSAPLAAPSFPGNLEGWTGARPSLDCLGNHHWRLHTVSWFLNLKTQSSLVCKLPRLRHFATPWGKADNTLSSSLFSESELGRFSTHFYPSGRKLKLSKKFTNSSWNQNINFLSQRQLKIFIYIWLSSLIVFFVEQKFCYVTVINWNCPCSQLGLRLVAALQSAGSIGASHHIWPPQVCFKILLECRELSFKSLV